MSLCDPRFVEFDEVPPEATSVFEMEVRVVRGTRFVLARPVAYGIGGKPSPLGRDLLIPAGYEWDGASGLLWAPAWVRAMLYRASLVHDALLRCHDPGYPDELCAPTLEPLMIHAAFYELAIADPDCARPVAWLAHRGVLLNGALRLDRRLRRASRAARDVSADTPRES